MKPIDKLMERSAKYADRVHFTVGEKPKTNADCIRAMTDEELADWFSLYCCRNKTYDAHCETFGNCKDCWNDWLKEEAKE